MIETLIEKAWSKTSVIVFFLHIRSQESRGATDHKSHSLGHITSSELQISFFFFWWAIFWSRRHLQLSPKWMSCQTCSRLATMNSVIAQCQPNWDINNGDINNGGWCCLANSRYIFSWLVKQCKYIWGLCGKYWYCVPSHAAVSV